MRVFDPSPKLQTILKSSEDLPPPHLPYLTSEGELVISVRCTNQDFLDPKTYAAWAAGKISGPDYWYSIEWEPNDNSLLSDVLNAYPTIDYSALEIFDKIWQFRLLMNTVEARSKLKRYYAAIDACMNPGAACYMM